MIPVGAWNVILNPTAGSTVGATITWYTVEIAVPSAFTPEMVIVANPALTAVNTTFRPVGSAATAQMAGALEVEVGTFPDCSCPGLPLASSGW